MSVLTLETSPQIRFASPSVLEFADDNSNSMTQLWLLPNREKSRRSRACRRHVCLVYGATRSRFVVAGTL